MSTLEQILKETMGAATGKMLRSAFSVIFFFGLLCMSTKAPDAVNPYVMYLFSVCMIVSIVMFFLSLFSEKRENLYEPNRPQITHFPNSDPADFHRDTDREPVRRSLDRGHNP